MLILVTTAAWNVHYATPGKASRQAHRYLRRKGVQPGEWATILHVATGAVRARYVRRDDGRVERVQ